jgi:hypothetical protein
VISKQTKQFLGTKISTLLINLDNSVLVLVVASVSVAFFALTVLVAQIASDVIIALIAVTVVEVIAVAVVEVDTAVVVEVVIAAGVDNSTFQLKSIAA